MSFHNYIYTSKAKSDLIESDLSNILASARAFNERHDITGMLLYSKSTFMQLLEGRKEDIYSLVDRRISKDCRHHSIYVVKETSMPQRYFHKWSMGFSNLDNLQVQEQKNYAQFFEHGFTNELVTNELNITHKLLLSFRCA